METLKPFAGNISEQTNKQVSFIATAHIVWDKYSNPLYKKAFWEYPTACKVTEEQIQEATKELAKRKLIELQKPNTIFFVNMGMNFDAKPGYISNHRTRAYFRNKYNHKCFIEVWTNNGIYSRKDNTEMRCDFAMNTTQAQNNYNYKNLVNRINNIENNKVQDYPLIEYTEKNLLDIINTYFDCNFEAIYFSDILNPEDTQAPNINVSPL